MSYHLKRDFLEKWMSVLNREVDDDTDFDDKVPPVRASTMEGYTTSPAQQPLLDVEEHDRDQTLSYSSDEESSNPATPYKKADPKKNGNGNSVKDNDNVHDLTVEKEPRQRKHAKFISTLSPKITRSDSVKFNKSANGNAGRKNSQPIGNSTPPKPSRRVPSLKLKRMSIERHADKSDSNMPCLPNCNKNKQQGNPSITITIDSDDDSVYSDYLNPDLNFKHDASKVRYIGDQTSLYGTPKEELLPNSQENYTHEQKSSPTSFLKEQIVSFFQPSDNKLAMKLFGNKNALMKEKLRHQRVGNWVIHPCSNFRCQDVVDAGKVDDIDINIDGGKWFDKKIERVKTETSVSDKTDEPGLPPVFGWKPFPSSPIPKSFNYGHIYHYLLESVVLLKSDGKNEDTDMSHMTAKPLTKGEQYVKSGSVHNLMDTVKKSTGQYFLKGKVDASMRQEQRDVMVALSCASGAILDASCTCPGSALGRCNHVAAILLTLDKHCKTDGHEPLACTSKPCEWNKGKRVKNPTKVEDAVYSSYKPKAAKLSDFDPRPKDMRHVSDIAVNDFVSDLKYHSLNTKRVSMWQTVLSIKYQDYDLDAERQSALKDMAWDFFTNLRSAGTAFNSDVYTIPGTEGQSGSEIWKASRWFRVTASTAKQANSLGSLIQTPPYDQSTHRKLYNYASYHLWGLHPFTTADTQYGIESEDQARLDYQNLMQVTKPGFNVIKTGFWVNKLWPELGCSPDGLVYDPTELNKYGLVEIKCPKILKTVAPGNIFTSLEEKLITTRELYNACFSRPQSANDVLELKTTHAYYYQIQFQLAITGLNWCDFVLWSPIGTPNVEGIRRDDQLIVPMMGNVTSLWLKVLAPELFEMRVPRKLFPFIID